MQICVNIPFTYDGGIDAFMKNEVITYTPDAYIDTKKTKIGYEIRFTRYFKEKHTQKDLKQIVDGIASLQKYMGMSSLKTNFTSYEHYTDIDEIWLSNVPKHWETIKIKHLFRERVEKGFPNEPLLAATQNMGVVPKKVYGQRTVEATKDLHLLKLVKVGDFVISLRSFQGGIELAYYQGIISPAYTILVPEGISIDYFKHLGKSSIFIKLLTQCITGIREGQNIDYSMLREIRIPVPSLDEQKKIARYLDSIDARIREIELLKKYKTEISSDVVTGQIDVRDIEIPEYIFEEETANSESEDMGEEEGD